MIRFSAAVLLAIVMPLYSSALTETVDEDPTTSARIDTVESPESVLVGIHAIYGEGSGQEGADIYNAGKSLGFGIQIFYRARIQLVSAILPCLGWIPVSLHKISCGV